MEIGIALLCVGVATLFLVLVYIMWSDRKLNKPIKEFKEKKMRESERSVGVHNFRSISFAVVCFGLTYLLNWIRRGRN
jgi:hypothetical protein